MNSLGSSSKWPSCDSLPSTPSFLLSENEQTEDEADIFSEGEADSGMRKTLPADVGIRLSASYLGFPDNNSHENQSEHYPSKAQRLGSTPSPCAAAVESSTASPGDLAFAQKCADLHRFISPLLELLHGLKAGRFDKGLTTFQQSVAMDRLQRILGILQKPEMGEKYLHNLLQIEMMLKMWFPRVALQPSVTLTRPVAPRHSPHWRQNQLHIPVKKRKFTWFDSDQPGNEPARKKNSEHEKPRSCQAAATLESVLTRLPGAAVTQGSPVNTTAEASGACWDEGQVFTHSTSTLDRSPYLCVKTETQPEMYPPSPCSSPATQDSSVSSSAPSTSADSP